MRVLSFIGATVISLSMMACNPADQGSNNGDKAGQEAQSNEIAKDVSAEELHNLYAEKGGQILDVRTDGEVAQGYIKDAIQIDFYRSDFDEEVAKLDKNKPVYVYCAVGGRSGKAMQKMKNMGFKEVYNLKGGFPTWANAGFEVSK